jgi:hypothetical protein
VLVNLSIIAMGVVTLWTDSGWPELVLGCFMIALALHAAMLLCGVKRRRGMLR